MRESSILVIEAKKINVQIAKLEKLVFPQDFYLYTGSAKLIFSFQNQKKKLPFFDKTISSA